MTFENTQKKSGGPASSPGRRGGPRRGDRGQRAVPEFEQKMVDLRRVARVTAGGRRFSFRATVIIGDRKGRVGVGVAKGKDTSLAIDKAVRNARGQLITVPLTKNISISRPVSAKYSASRVFIAPASLGSGLGAGGSVRVVLDLLGVKNASAKIFSRSRNKINNARATLKALQSL